MSRKLCYREKYKKITRNFVTALQLRSKYLMLRDAFCSIFNYNSRNYIGETAIKSRPTTCAIFQSRVTLGQYSKTGLSLPLPHDHRMWTKIFVAWCVPFLSPFFSLPLSSLSVPPLFLAFRRLRGLIFKVFTSRSFESCFSFFLPTTKTYADGRSSLKSDERRSE